jgi:hypothetical protein
MKIVKDDIEPDAAKNSKPKATIFTAEFRRKWRLEFIAAHNEKIKRMKDKKGYIGLSN